VAPAGVSSAAIRFSKKSSEPAFFHPGFLKKTSGFEQASPRASHLASSGFHPQRARIIQAHLSALRA
jgi:hypothetical protein